MKQKIDPLCTVIRFAPVGVLLLAHCVQVIPSPANRLHNDARQAKVYFVSVHWPTDEECMEKVLYYGFSVNAFKTNRWTLLTHLFIHGSANHLLSNMFSLASTLMEFGGTDMRENMTEKRVWVNVKRMLGSFVVMVAGGVVGGLGFQLLYNDSKVLPYKRQIEHLRNSTSGAAGEGGGGGVTGKLAHVVQQAGDHISTAVKGVASPHTSGGTISIPDNGTSATISISSDNIFSRALSSVGNRLASWKAHTQMKLQEHVNDSMFMCGASAGICALAGFNATYYQRPICTLCIVLPELIVFGQQLFNGGGEGFWYTLLPGNTVGHAAHVGGFLAGAVMGAVAKRLWPRRLYKRNGEEVEEN